MLTDLLEISMAVDTPQSHLDVRWRSALRVGQPAVSSVKTAALCLLSEAS
jgi:hypothetical protein